jgi:hypothetical protein
MMIIEDMYVYIVLGLIVAIAIYAAVATYMWVKEGYEDTEGPTRYNYPVRYATEKNSW